MKEVFINPDSARVGLYKSLLVEAGIPCYVRNETGNMIAGLPIPMFYPALCIINDADLLRAKQIIDTQAETAVGGEWICPKCKSLNPSTFGSCWNCQAEREL